MARHGIDKMFVASTTGMAPGSIAKIAWAVNWRAGAGLESVTGGRKPGGTLIFDEVDAGVGGAVAGGCTLHRWHKSKFCGDP